MNKHEHHAELVSGFLKEQKQIFDSSSQAIYAFLDDDCRVCNQKFATFLGYSSPEEWFKVDVQGAFPVAFVDTGSQKTLVTAYQNAMVVALVLGVIGFALALVAAKLIGARDMAFQRLDVDCDSELEEPRRQSESESEEQLVAS